MSFTGFHVSRKCNACVLHGMCADKEANLRSDSGGTQKKMEGNAPVFRRADDLQIRHLTRAEVIGYLMCVLHVVYVCLMCILCVSYGVSRMCVICVLYVSCMWCMCVLCVSYGVSYGVSRMCLMCVLCVSCMWFMCILRTLRISPRLWEDIHHVWHSTTDNDEDYLNALFSGVGQSGKRGRGKSVFSRVLYTYHKRVLNVLQACLKYVL